MASRSFFLMAGVALRAGVVEIDPLIDAALQVFRTRLIEERAERNGQDNGTEETGILERQDRSDGEHDIPF